MPKIIGTNVISPIVPFTSDDTYPTHCSKFGQGGHRSVENVSERNSIPSPRRELYMTVGVVENGIIYKLISNPIGDTTTDSDWKDVRDIDIVDVVSDNIILWQNNMYKSFDLTLATISLNTSTNYGKIIWNLGIKDVLPNISFSNTILWRYDNDLILSLNSFNVFEFETWDGGNIWLGRVNKYSISTPEDYIDREELEDAVSSLTWQAM